MDTCFFVEAVKPMKALTALITKGAGCSVKGSDSWEWRFCEAKYYSEPFTLQMIPAIREVKVKKPFKAGRLCA